MKKRQTKTKGLYLRGNVWWMTYRGPDGRQYWESCRTRSKSEAQALLEKRRVEAREGRLPELKRIKPVTFTELEAEYLLFAKKQRSYTSKVGFIKKLREYFGQMKLTELTTRTVEQYQTKLISEGLKPASGLIKIIVSV